MRTLLLCCITFVVLGSYPVHAGDTKKSLAFYPPFNVVEIAELVQQRQGALSVTQFHTMLTVQYGTRIEWMNACSWLNAQTEDVMRFYAPPQNDTDEFYYYCGISRTYTEASVDSLSVVHELTNDLTRQFGGAITNWSFSFRDHSGRDEYAYMGLAIAKLSPETCAEVGIAKGSCVREGAIVAAITGAPARTAGLQKGDILVRLNEQPVSDANDVIDIVRNASPGDAFYATVLRGSREVQVGGVFGRRD
jgi:membrane-associated protease RseP (regulator of RpoE activity)